MFVSALLTLMSDPDSCNVPKVASFELFSMDFASTAAFLVIYQHTGRTSTRKRPDGVGSRKGGSSSTESHRWYGGSRWTCTAIAEACRSLQYYLGVRCMSSFHELKSCLLSTLNPGWKEFGSDMIRQLFFCSHVLTVTQLAACRDKGVGLSGRATLQSGEPLLYLASHKNGQIGFKGLQSLQNKYSNQFRTVAVYHKNHWIIGPYCRCLWAELCWRVGRVTLISFRACRNSQILWGSVCFIRSAFVFCPNHLTWQRQQACFETSPDISTAPLRRTLGPWILQARYTATWSQHVLKDRVRSVECRVMQSAFLFSTFQLNTCTCRTEFWLILWNSFVSDPWRGRKI